MCVCAHECLHAPSYASYDVICRHMHHYMQVGFSSPFLFWGSEDWTHIVRLGGESPSLWAILPAFVFYVRIKNHNRHKMLLSLPENVLCIKWSSYFSHFFFKGFYLKICLFYLCVGMCPWLEVSVEARGTGVTGSWELPDVGAGNQACVLGKTSECSSPLRHLCHSFSRIGFIMNSWWWTNKVENPGKSTLQNSRETRSHFCNQSQHCFNGYSSV